MPAELKLEKFEGPLDLLLKLIDEQELSITDISLTKVIEQFFVYMDDLEVRQAEELADFLVIATKLVYLKSRELLPYLLSKDEDDEMGLAEQLKLYKQYLEATKYVKEKWENGAMSFGRTEPLRKSEKFEVPKNAKSEHLYTMMLSLVSRLKPIKPLPEAKIDKSISIKNKIENFYNLLTKHRQISFSHLINESKNRTEVIITFLALLELTKQQKINFQQTGSFSDILITKNE